MITRGLLDQLLKSGQDLLQNNQQARANNPSTSNQQSGGGLGDLLGGAVRVIPREGVKFHSQLRAGKACHRSTSTPCSSHIFLGPRAPWRGPRSSFKGATE